MASDNDVTVFRPGGITYVHIPALDPRLSATFYEAVFGWKVSRSVERCSFEDGSGNVIGAWVTDVPVVGLGGVVPYVYVDDVALTLAAVADHGGEIAEAPYPEGELTVATIRDPAGNVVGVWQRT